MITRRDALAVVGLAAMGVAAPAFGHHGGETSADDLVLGDPAAPITIIEYASLTCPHCASFHNDTLSRIKERYIDAGKVRLIYRDFPFDSLAMRAAVVARCAGREQYFGILEALFRTQRSWAGAQKPFEALARVARLGGLKREEIDACLADKALTDAVLASRLNGAKECNVTSTPTFIINGEKVVGAQKYERFEEILDRMLEKP